jgi:hypothetical protein
VTVRRWQKFALLLVAVAVASAVVTGAVRELAGPAVQLVVTPWVVVAGYWAGWLAARRWGL